MSAKNALSKILVTGFKPFFSEKINPSEKLALELEKTNSNIKSLILPVEYLNSFEILKNEIQIYKPDHLMMLGQAAGRKNICLEKIALNWAQSEQSDEAGFLVKPGSILQGQPLALMSKFPIEKIYFELQKQQQPAEVSFSAGTFVCNDLYYRTLSNFENLKSVFIHVPLLPEQLKPNDLRPSLVFETQLEILLQMILLLNKVSHNKT